MASDTLVQSVIHYLSSIQTSETSMNLDWLSYLVCWKPSTTSNPPPSFLLLSPLNLSDTDADTGHGHVTRDTNTDIYMKHGHRHMTRTWTQHRYVLKQGHRHGTRTRHRHESHTWTQTQKNLNSRSTNNVHYHLITTL